MSIIAELKRRNVIRVGVAYVIAAWLTLQFSDVILGNIEAPGWVFQAILLVIIIGFPLAMIFAWAFELTPEGLKRESEIERSRSVTQITGQKLDRAIIVVLILAITYFAYDKFSGRQAVNSIPIANVTAKQTSDITAPRKPSIAVLPFVNMSSDPEQDYFSDGISEELLNLLAKIPQFQVAGRTSSFAFKGKNDDLRQIGESLGVENIIEGSVRKGGDRVRITAQLVKVDDGFHLWSESYDRELDDILAVQDDIARAVVNALKVTLLDFDTGDENIALLYANADAHSDYLQGLFFMNKEGPDNRAKAVRFFQQAVDRVPDSALAWAGLARANILFSTQASDYAVEALAQGRKDLVRAFALSDEIPEAYLVQGELAMFYDWDWDAADKAIQRALSLRPGDLAARLLRAELDVKLGNIDEAFSAFQDLLARDPLNTNLQGALMNALIILDRLEEAAAMSRHLLANDPTGSFLNATAAMILYLDGRDAEALEFAKKETVSFARLIFLAVIRHRLGNIEAAIDAQQELLDQYGDSASYQQAHVFAAWGEIDTAIEWLERAYDVRDPGLQALKTDVLLRPLFGRPGFNAILEKMNLAE